MNVGLANLFTLKSHLQGIALTDETRFDSVLQDIGLGVAGQMENFCDRKFARVAGDTFVAPADRASFILPRYPIEAVSLVEFKADETNGWVSDGPTVPTIVSSSTFSGLVYLGDVPDPGAFYMQVRFTFTGGYWFETEEPTNADGSANPNYPTAQPAGSTPLPYDLRLAWLTQCRRVWAAFDKLGTKVLDDSAAGSAALAAMDWSPEAREILARYRRMTLI